MPACCAGAGRLCAVKVKVRAAELAERGVAGEGDGQLKSSAHLFAVSRKAMQPQFASKGHKRRDWMLCACSPNAVSQHERRFMLFFPAGFHWTKQGVFTSVGFVVCRGGHVIESLPCRGCWWACGAARWLSRGLLVRDSAAFLFFCFSQRPRFGVIHVPFIYCSFI